MRIAIKSQQSWAMASNVYNANILKETEIFLHFKLLLRPRLDVIFWVRSRNTPSSSGWMVLFPS